MKNFNPFLIVLFLLITGSLNAQDFLRPFETISHKKPTYLTMADGNEIEGTVKKLDKKRGLIEEIRIMVDGSKKTYDIETIDFAYFPQSGWDKFAKASDFLNDAQQWKKGPVDKDRMKDGYAYFEKANVIVKKKEMTLLMQLLNPMNCGKLKVYHDPFAMETAGIGFGGIQVAGGDDKSYYLSKDGETAVRFTKKNFRKEFEAYFADCPEVVKEYMEAPWRQFSEIVNKYNDVCGSKE